MSRLAFLLAVLLALVAPAACSTGRVTPVADDAPAPDSTAVALRGVTVVDVRPGASAVANQGRLVAGQTVLIAGGRIAAVGPAGRVRVPRGARVVDASGKYVIPGLWDMHAHLRSAEAMEIDMPLLVAHGVTGVREMAAGCRTGPAADSACVAQMRDRQRRIDDGTLTGPRLLALGSWIVQGPRGLPDSLPRFFGAATAEQGRELARYFKARGVDFIKIYSQIPRDGFFGLVEEARRLGLPVVGHEPTAVSAVELSDAGMRSVEHARVFLFHCWRGAAEFWKAGQPPASPTAFYRRIVDEYDPARCADVFRAFVRNGTWYVPTHLTRKTEAFAHDSAMRRDPRMAYVSRRELFGWNADMGRVDASDSSAAGRAARLDFYRKGLQVTGAAHRAGVKLLVGTDVGDSFIFPGSSLHDELAELVAAGLTPAEALRAATWSGAEFLGLTTDFGSVERGKVADLVLLDANPLADVANTRGIAAVVLGGRYWDRAALDTLLDGARRAAAR